MSQAVDAAEVWLLAQQRGDGSFAGSEGLAPRDAAQVVLGLAGRSASEAAVAAAADYLSTAPEGSAELRSLRALALARVGRPQPALTEALLGFRRGGGVAPFAAYQPSLFDTALAMQALAGDESRFLLELAALLDFLRVEQGGDGGWGYLPDEPSAVYFTAEALVALAILDQIAVADGVLSRAVDFLIGRQQPDGGFGAAVETAVAYRALSLAGRSAASFPHGSPVPFLLAAQRADGSWDGDAFTTALVVRALGHERPNLRLVALEAPTSAAPGLPIRVVATVANAGAEPAAASRLELRSGSRDGEPVAAAEVAELAAGAESVHELEVATAGLTGTLDLYAVADAAEVVEELDEDDNVASARVTLRAGPDLALFPEDLEPSVELPEPGEAFDLLVSARNLGETDVATLGYRVERWVDGAPAELLASGATGPIAAGAGRLVSVPLGLPEGEHLLAVVLDPAGEVAEENESNNRATRTLFVVDEARPDLALGEADVVLTPPAPAAGEAVEVSITLRNLGTREATGELVLLENGSAGGALDGSELRRWTVSLPAGGAETLVDSLPLGATAFALTAIADPERRVLEIAETNNRVRRTFRDLPDLAIGFDNFEIESPAPLPGDEVPIVLTVRNAGTAAAHDVVVTVFDGEPAAGNPIYSTVFPEIPVAGNRTATLAWTAVAGRTTLVAVADPDDAAIELAESNNRQGREVFVARPSGPDLEIAAIDLSALVQSATALTAAGNVAVRVVNEGDADVTVPFLVRLFEDRDGDGAFGASDALLASSVVSDPLAVGASLVAGFAIDQSLGYLHPLAWAEVDATDVVAEIDEEDNRRPLFCDCESVPPAGSAGPLEPVEEWWLTGLEVESTPVVVQLSDDDGDGRIDSRDVPDVVFHTTDAGGSAVVAVSGLDGSRHWTFRSTAANPVLGFLGQVAAADLDGDGVAEVVGQQSNGRLIALRHDGSLSWVSDPVEGAGGLGGPAIGDLDGDGVPEIAVGRAVLSHLGRLIAIGSGNRGQNQNYYGPFGVVVPPGVYAYPSAAIADVDLDGRNELVAGDTLYRLEGGALQTVWDVTVPDKLMVDGFSAVANLDADPQAEIVYVSSGQILVLNHDGSYAAGRREMVGFSPFQLPTYWGGVPAVADLDGDGKAEILVVTATHLIAYNGGLGKRWQRELLADFGGFHGATAFDLDGDGRREVLVIADNAGDEAVTFFILDGTTGATRYSRKNVSKTAMESPIVVDVDGDGRAEILVPSNTGFSGDASTRGLHVLGHPSWRGARKVWNQYSYHVTNVALDGTVPSPEIPAWQAGNLFRANREQPAPAKWLLPNLSLSFPRVGKASSAGVPITLRVGNGGRAALPAGIAVELFVEAVGGAPVVAAATSRALPPGQWEDVLATWTAPSPGDVPVVAVVDRAGRVVEARDDDDELAFVLTETLLPDLAIAAGGVTAASPVAAGQRVRVEVRVENVGNAAAPASVVRFFDGPPAQGRVLGEVPVEALASGAAATVAFTWDTIGESGLRLLYAVVDAEGAVLEQRRENNEGLVAVELVPASRPDLELESLTATPSAVDAGVDVLLAARVRNRGARLEGGLEVLLRANNGALGRVSTPAALDGGEAIDLRLTLPTAAYAGTVALTAKADPDDRLDEENEANNQASASLVVRRRTLSLTVTTDRLSYGPQQPVAIQVVAKNTGTTARSLDLVVRLVDALGAVAAPVAEQPLALAAAQTATIGSSGDTAALPAGSYSVVAELLEGGVSLVRSSALLTIAKLVAPEASLFTDREVYPPLQAVELAGTVRNASPNATLSSLTARLAVTAAGGATVFAQERLVPALYPASSLAFNATWEIANAAAGGYTASLGLRDATGGLLAYAESPFRVESSGATGAGLEGDLAAMPAEVAAGGPVVIDFEVSNRGNDDVVGLGLRFDLVRASDGVRVDSQLRPLDLARAESAAGSVGFATQGRSEGAYLVSMVAVAPERETRLDRVGLTVVPGVSVLDATTDEGDAGARPLAFTVRLSSPREVPVTVELATSDGSALAGSDYEATRAGLVFEAGEIEKAVTVTVFGDGEPESEEAFVVNLAAAAGIEIGDGQALGVLRDEEGCASRNLLANGDAEEADEGASIAGWSGAGWRRRFALPAPLSGAASFGVAVSSGTSGLTQDVDLGAFAAAIDAGLPLFAFDGFAQVGEGSEASVRVDYLDAEGGVLSSFESGSIAPAEGWRSVADQRAVPAGVRGARIVLAGGSPNDAAVSFDRLSLRSVAVVSATVSDAEVLEGDAGSTPARLTVALSCARATGLDLDVATADQTALAGLDYSAVAATLTVPAGERGVELRVEVAGDALDEPDETFAVVTRSADVVVLDPLATVTVLDDDGPVYVSIDDLAVAEGDADGAVPVVVRLSAPSGKHVEVDYRSEDAGATAPADYAALSGRLGFAPGEVEATIQAALVGDRLDEPDETFVVRLSSPRFATLAGSAAVVTLIDDDVVAFSLDDPTVVEGDPAGTSQVVAQAVFTVRLSLPSVAATSVAYAAADGLGADAALVGADYLATGGTLTFAPGSVTRTVTVPVVADLFREPLETFRLVLSSPVGGILGDPEGSAAIVDDDGILISVGDAEAIEPPGFPLNLGRLYGAVAAASSTYGHNPGYLPFAVDGRLDTSWYPNPGDTPTQGQTPWLEVQLPQASRLVAVRLFGNRNAPTGYDYFAGYFTFFDAGGNVLHESEVVDLPAPDRDLVLTVPETAGVFRVRFTGTAGEGAYPGISELEAIGFPEATNLSLAAGTTAAASSIYSAAYPASRAIDGNPVTAWYPRPGDAVNQGGAPWIEVLLATPATVRELRLYGERQNSGYDYLAGVLELFDDDGALLWASGVVDLPAPLHDGVVAVPDVSGARRVRFSSTADVNTHPGLGELQVWGAFDAELVVPVTLSKAPITEIGVHYATADETATAGEDYQAASGSLLFPIGATRRDLGLDLLPDDEAELTERFRLELSDPVEGLLLDSQGLLSIRDDDRLHLNGDAAPGDLPGCVTLTPDLTYRRGSAWSGRALDLGQSFDKTFRVHLGTRASGGGEGVYFALQRSGPTALGGSLGYSGIAPSVGVEIDTLVGSKDQISIDFDGQEAGTPTVDASATQARLADAAEHELRVIWNAGQRTLDVHLDGQERLRQSHDLVATTFGGAPLVTWGFTAATTGSRNLQYFCPLDGGCAPGVPPTVSVGDVSIFEGTGSGATVMSFPVTLSCPSEETVTVDVATEDETARAGSDFGAVSTALVFAPGETAKQVEVTVVRDLDPELTESFRLRLSAPVGAELLHEEGIGTIEADDWGTEISQAAIVEGGLSRSYYFFTVDLRVVPTQQVRVQYKILAGTATANQDFVATNGELVYQPGQRLATLRLDVIGDAVAEPAETVFLDLSSSAALFAPRRITLEILDDDECPSTNLLRNAGADTVVAGELPGWTEVLGTLWTGTQRVGRINEPYHFFPGGGPVPVAELAQDVDVSTWARPIDAGEQTFAFLAHLYSFTPDTGRVVVEYRDAAGAILSAFDTGEIAHTLGLYRAIGDRRVAPRGTRSIRVRLIATDHNGSWTEAFFDGLSLLTLRFPSVDVGDASSEEGALGERSLLLPLTLRCAGPLPIAVSYLTADGTAQAGSDYRATAGTQSFQPGEVATTIAVPVLGDTVVEGNESFFLKLHGSVEAGIGDGEAVATILDDESRISVANASTVETSSGEVDTLFVVTLDRPSEAEIEARFTTGDGTARAGEDYRSASGKVELYPGATSATVSVKVLGDTDEEPDETFYLRLSDPENAEIADGEAVGTIIQDDIAVSIANATVLEGNVATTFVSLEVTLSVPSSTVVTVDWATADASAVAGEDYVAASGRLSFPAGATKKTVAVTVRGDEQREGSETFFVRLSNPVNAMTRIAEGTAFIIDDDDCPSPNLLRNPSGESALANGVVPFWTQVGSGAWPRGANPAPIDGKAFFQTSGQAYAYELDQEVSVETYAAYVDAGLQRFSFEGFVRSQVEATPDAGRIVVEYRGADGSVLAALDSGEIASPTVWQPVGDLRLAPAGTRSIRVRLLAVSRVAGGGVSVYFDGLGLRSVGTPVLLPSDVELTEGDESPVDAVFALDLLCPSDERTITLDYATKDRTAVGGSDYTPLTGSLTYSPGEAAKTVVVETLGDYRREVSETFFLEFSNVVNAVVLYPRSTATLVDDDPGNAPVPPTLGSDVIYTFDEDFELGYLVSVQHDDPEDDQLQLSEVGSTYPYIWIAASSRGTIVKIDTRSGEILSEISTSPDNRGSNPSRTTVILDGSVWVTNRDGQSVAHAGLVELNQCVDRNGNGTIETSTAYGQVLPWPNKNGEDNAGGISTAADECLLHYVPTTAWGTRHISIRDESSIWVSGTGGRQFDLIDVNAGKILRTETGFACGGYGGLTDRNGVVWSATAGSLLRWDPAVVPATAQSKRCLSVPGAYGVAIDSEGWIWVSNVSGDQVWRVSPDGNTWLGPFRHGSPAAQGLAVDGLDDVWVSSSLFGGSTTVGHLKRDGTFVGSVFDVPDGSTGVAIDSQGYVWTANITGSASRIDPLKGPIGADGVTPIGEVDLVVPLPGAGPYNYSDMTGFVGLQATSKRGSWSVIQDSGAAGSEWGMVAWNWEPEGSVPAGASLVVEARIADTVVGLGAKAFFAVASGVAFEQYGRYLQVRVTFQPSAAGESPVLSDLRIGLTPEGEVTAHDASVTEGTGGTTPVEVEVTLVEPTLREVVARYATTDGTAKAGEDYLARSGTVTFNPGETVATISLDVVADDQVEDSESFDVVLSDLFNGTFLDAVATVTIADDDVLAGPPVLRATKVDDLREDADGDGQPSPGDGVGYVVAVSNLGESAATEVVFRDLVPEHASLVAGSIATDLGTVVSEEPLEVALGTLAAGATANIAFAVRVADLLPVGVGAMSNQGTVLSIELPALPTDDPDVGGEADPTVTVIVASPRLVAEKTAALAVDRDGDGAPSPGDDVAYTIVVKNLGNAIATGVRFADPPPEHATIVAGSLASDRGTVDGEDPVRVEIGELEPDAVATIRFRVAVESPVAAGVEEIRNQGTVRADGLADLLTDDPAVGGEADPTVTAIAAAPAVRVEKTDTLLADTGDDGVASPGDVLLYRITVENVGNSGATGVALRDVVDPDTELVSGSVQTDRGSVVGEDPLEVAIGLLPAATTATVTFRVAVAEPFPPDRLAVSNQATVEGEELERALSDDPDTEAPADPTATEIFWRPALSVADVEVVESASAPVDAVFALALDRASAREARVAWTTVEASAEADLDFTPVSGIAVFPPGVRQVNAVVQVLPDTLAEPVETFLLRLSQPLGLELVDPEATASIVDDTPDALSIDDVVVDEGDSGTTAASFTVSLGRPATAPVRVAWAAADGSAGEEDYEPAAGTLEIQAGEQAGAVVVEVVGDEVDEDDETLVVRLDSAVGAGIEDAEGEGTILDDDDARLSIADVEVDEGDAGVRDAVFAVTLSTPADREVEVDYSTSAGTAEEGVDFLAASGSIAFEPLATEASVSVPVVGDVLLEDDEAFEVELTHPDGAEVADGRGLGTILDDEVCPGPNLVANPGAETRGDGEGIPGWVEVQGQDWHQRLASPEPYEGRLSLAPGEADVAELVQVIDVSAFAPRVDAGTQLFFFSGRVRTFDELPADLARVVVELLDANGVVLEAYDSGEIVSPTAWREVRADWVAPVGTRHFRLRLFATRFSGVEADAYFDAFELRSLRTPAISVTDTSVFEGDSGTVDAVSSSSSRVPSSTSWPWPSPPSTVAR